MPAELSPELLAFHAFVKSTLSKGGSIDEDATPAAFLEYQDQLNRLRAALQPAATRFQENQAAADIDIDRFVDEVLQHQRSDGEPT